MQPQHAPTEARAGQRSRRVGIVLPRPALAGAFWVTLVALSLGLFAASIPALYAQRHAPSADIAAGLARLDIPERFYAGYVTGLLAVFELGCFAVAVLIVRHRPTDPVALFVSLFLVLMGGFNHPNVQALAAAHPALEPLFRLAWGLLTGTMILFIHVFPDGKFVPRWMRVPVGLWMVGALLALLFGGGSLAQPPDALGLVLIVALLAGTISQVYRYRNASSPEGRQQTKWIVLGITAAVTTQVVSMLVAPFVTAPGIPALAYTVTSVTLVTLASLLIPLTIGIAILRYRLWDIDLIISRALVYGALTACVVALYVLAVGGLGVLLQSRGNLLVSLLSTGLVAALFAPLREQLQRGVNRLVYGERDDPYGVLSRLGQQLETTLAPEAVLPAVVENVGRALRLPQVAIWLADGDTLRLVAAHGATSPEAVVHDTGAMETLHRAPDGLGPADLAPSSTCGALLARSGASLVLPLTHRGELVGAFCVASRGPGENFSPADRRLLRDLASQTGAAAHTVRLTVELRSSLEELRHSREKLVAAQEVERRRIQRDLHDGLGPILASIRLRLEACLNEAQEANTPLTSDLERLYELVGQATGDIRRLVYDLRPPVLDQLGLVAAVRQHCERFSRESDINLRLETAENLHIPAAAEVALLRVVQEALHNVDKHARATHVDVHLETSDGWLSLVIRDNGVGFETGSQEGTGIGSMRERADLLGGAFRIESETGAGTGISMRIPISDYREVGE